MAGGDGPDPTRRILVVEDEPSVLGALTELLQRLGWNVLPAVGGTEALALFRERPRDVDLVLLDLTLPDLDGIAVFREMEALRPGVRVVLSSGLSQEDLADRTAGLGFVAFLEKPYSFRTLRETLARVVGAGPAETPRRKVTHPA